MLQIEEASLRNFFLLSVCVYICMWMEESGRLQFMGLQRVGHDWATSLLQTNWKQTGKESAPCGVPKAFLKRSPKVKFNIQLLRVEIGIN